MKQKLFIDANFFCAIHNKTDLLYKKAEKIISTLSDYALVTSNFVLLESYTVISQRSSKNQAIIFREIIFGINAYEILWLDKNTEDKTWRIFASVKDKNFSYVDASILALIQKEKIGHLLSFDKGFKPLQEKFKFSLIGAQ